ncbi:cysteine hydrolase [Rhodobacteraceae bacterium D3-12]|nr:cysteine hydrolase [Rhodobacteraceae bacterium D3-12]
MSKDALILVDIQNDYFPGGLWPVEGMEAAAERAAHLLSAARTSGQMVVHVRHEMASDKAPFFRPASKGAEIADAVAPAQGEMVLTKARPNSFLGTGLFDLLKAADVTAVTLCGAMSQMCIDATARAAADHGFKVRVVADACAAKSLVFNEVSVPAPQVHATIMAALQGTYAEIVTAKDITA